MPLKFMLVRLLLFSIPISICRACALCRQSAAASLLGPSLASSAQRLPWASQLPPRSGATGPAIESRYQDLTQTIPEYQMKVQLPVTVSPWFTLRLTLPIAEHDEDDADQTAPPSDGEKPVSDDREEPMSAAMIGTIRVYKEFISPLLPPACRFLPTCSQYGVQAIQEYGPWKGGILTAWRLLRCSPFGGKGYDPPRWPPVAYWYSSY